jgi:hypothetical protein
MDSRGSGHKKVNGICRATEGESDKRGAQSSG